MQSLQFSPSNSQVFISGSLKVKVPILDGTDLIRSNNDCVSVTCLPDIDGSTFFFFGREEEINSPLGPAFNGEIATPDRKLLVSTVPMEVLFSTEVPDISTRVTVRLNHDRWPDQVVIGWS